MKSPKERYERRKNYYSKLLEKQRKTLSVIGNLRLFVTLAGIGNLAFLYIAKNNNLIGPIFFAYLVIFIYLVIKHNQMKIKAKYTGSLYKINDDSCERIKGEWKSFSDTGEEYIDENHFFSYDLDIFGKGSLFQWINTSMTYMGRHRLKEYLTKLCENKEEIYRRQEAVTELAKKLWWRQRFLAEGMINLDKSNNPEHLYKWAENKKEFYLKKWLKTGVRVLPIISILLIIAYFFTDKVSYHFPLLALGIQILILKFHNKERSKILNSVYKHKNNIKLYRKMLRQFEVKEFKVKYLQKLKGDLTNDEKLRAYQQIDKLEKIVDSISNRNNALFILINIIILWDYQCMIALEEWKVSSGHLIKDWLEIIGELEALSSLAVIRHDNPDWAMPIISNKEAFYEAKNIGHPLITKNRVCNDFKIKEPTRVLMITGSNMSGKSTFLRTTGINLLLTYLGAPVCADAMTCSIMKIHTCMRISDNLEKNISSFYAELLRIKEIVKAAKGEKQIFFLLDEIFKGTNSEDRHEGAIILIKNLLATKSIGLVSTHDLELGVLEEESHQRVKNFHFQEYYKDNEIYFDYRLKPGVSTTRNALYLIKMTGIDE